MQVQVQRLAVGIGHGGVVGLQIVGQAGRRLSHGAVIEDCVLIAEQALLHDVRGIGRARADGQQAGVRAQQSGIGRAAVDHAQHRPGRG
ncbi:hypothetical protein GY14_23485 [Delftia tsuruhatensis]|nr:hypothetical protein GY14_23485 [Delftia tsuruhatensis]